MVSVLKTLPNVMKLRLIVSHRPNVHVVLNYDYRHQDRSIGHENADITRLILREHDRQVVDLGGLHSPGQDLDDADSGMIRFTDLWRKQCGLDLEVVTN